MSLDIAYSIEIEVDDYLDPDKATTSTGLA